MGHQIGDEAIGLLSALIFLRVDPDSALASELPVGLLKAADCVPATGPAISLLHCEFGWWQSWLATLHTQSNEASKRILCLPATVRMHI